MNSLSRNIARRRTMINEAMIWPSKMSDPNVFKSSDGSACRPKKLRLSVKWSPELEVKFELNDSDEERGAAGLGWPYVRHALLEKGR
jgi:hypothetical protein